MLFSATLSTRVHHLAWEHMRDPVEIEVSPENLTVEEVTQELYHVSRDEKVNLLLGILLVAFPLELVAAGAAVAETHSNDLGEFQMTASVNGPVGLRLHLADAVVEVTVDEMVHELEELALSA